MKAPILRLAPGDNRGDIDIANETINYFAKPTIVKSLKGQGGADLDALSGIGIPLKITGSFSSPKFGMDFASLGTAVAKSNLLDKVGGEKGGAVKELLGSGTKVDALKNLLDKKKPAESVPDANSGTTTTPAPTEAPKSNEDQIKDKATSKLKKMLNF
jgi:AsmA protein